MLGKSKLLHRTKQFIGKYKHLVRRINKRRERQNTIKHINNVLNDFEDSFYDDIHEQGLIGLDECEDEDWLEYLGKTWTLDDELEYCDRVYKDVDDEMLVDDVINAFKLSNNVDIDDPVERAIVAGKGCRAMQELWQRHGVDGRYKLLFED